MTGSNIGFPAGTVGAYDTLQEFDKQNKEKVLVSKDIIKIISHLSLSSENTSKIKVMDIGQQSNTSDCVVYSLAIAFDICSNNNPCSVEYDNNKVREHLMKCIEECEFSRFPVISARHHRFYLCGECKLILQLSYAVF